MVGKLAWMRLSSVISKVDLSCEGGMNGWGMSLNQTRDWGLDDHSSICLPEVR